MKRAWPVVWRLFVGIVPLVFACQGAVAFAQNINDQRLASLEISDARQDERYVAILARLDGFERTQWWLVVATLGGTGVSGAVAADRAAHKWKQRGSQ